MEICLMNANMPHKCKLSVLQYLSLLVLVNHFWKLVFCNDYPYSAKLLEMFLNYDLMKCLFVCTLCDHLASQSFLATL